MIKKLCFIVPYIFFLQLITAAQPQRAVSHTLITPPDFGKITLEELQIKECSFEKGAPAINLLQYESVEFVVSNYSDYKLVTETTCRIKIFNKNGFQHATIIIPYVGRNRTSKIIDIEGSTYNLDETGKIVAVMLNRKEIFRDKDAEKNRDVLVIDEQNSK
ncbi:hypothetical protein BH10BAC2_BH10BAC2_44950 [soil metagenome]